MARREALTREEQQLLFHLAHTDIRGDESVSEERTAATLIECGYIECDDSGAMRITEEGRRVHRQWCNLC